MTKYRDDQLTDWFPPEIKPVHVGVYQTDFCGYAHWNGKKWGYGRLSPLDAKTCAVYRSAIQNKSWRGLNFNPQAGESEQAV